MKSIKNKYLFFILRIWKDIFNPTIWPISNDLWSQKLGEYYFVFTEEAMENQKGGQKSIVYDDDGIPMNPTYVDVKDKDFVYFPLTIGQVGLAIFHTYLKTNLEKDKERFLKFPNWFFDNAIEDEKLGVRWMTDVALPQYRNPGPWQSAFVQGRGISNLLRGYQLTGKEEWREMAEKALISFTIPVSEGGVTSFIKHGSFYEEYTAEVPTCVLNGMIFAMCGVTDFVRVFPEHKLARKLYDEGIETLKNSLPDFDLGYWSKYNLVETDWYPKNDPSTITYQHLHITQLQMLYNLTEEKTFKEYADKFKKQMNIFNILKMYILKYKSLKKLGRL
ncbi:MAG: D-glucuronyl C5-epimerase family protein [Melioribacteraceae bacterium]